MFVKVFAQILDSTIADDWQVRHVFEDLLKLADYKSGIVDMTPAAISRRLGVPLDIVARAIEALSQPDPDSRSAEEQGRRIVLLDEHRAWGWRIVNYEHYRNIRDEEDRRTYFRERKRMQRARVSDSPKESGQSLTVQDSERQSKDVTHTDTDTDVEVDVKAKTTSALRSDERPAGDPRHASFKKELAGYWEDKNPTTPEMPWGPADAKQLSSLLKENPSLNVEQFRMLLANRASSAVAHGERVYSWILNVTKFSEPLDQYGKPISRGGNHAISNRNQARTDGNKTAARAAIAAIADIAAGGFGGSTSGISEPGEFSRVRGEVGSIPI